MKKWSQKYDSSFEKFSYKGELRTTGLAGERCGFKEKTDGLLGKCDRGEKDSGVEVLA